MPVDIFSQVKPEETKWFNFKNVGDAIQGTYIGMGEIAKDNFGNRQIVYKLLDADGTTWNVGIKEDNKAFVNRMAEIRFGQIVGIKYGASIPTTKGNPFKKLDIYASPTEVDEVWMKKQAAELEAIKRLDAVQGVNTLAADVAAVTAPQAPGAPSSDQPF